MAKDNAKMDAFMAPETVRTIYTVLAFFAIGFFFLSMLFASWLIMVLALVSDEANGKQASFKFVKKVSFISRMPLVGMIAGCYLWIFLQLWILVTNVHWMVFVCCAGGAVVMLSAAFFAMVMTVRALYAVSAEKQP